MLILSGLKHSVDVEKVANKWVDNHAAALSSKSPESDSARRWIKINVRLQTKALEAALKQIYGSGWAFGNTDSEAQLYGEIADPWAGWNAGNEAAAALVDPPKGLKNLLDKSGITLEGIIGTTLDQMGTQLADSLSRGLGARETADNLLNVINDPARAMVIARTETARAVCDSNVANYSENGVTQMQWISADPCILCAENEGVIVEIGEQFPTGDEYPPAHPNCVCDVSPVGSVDKTINKYSPDQERDERGRFGSGSGESESTPDYHMQHQPTLREDEFGSPAHDIEEMMPQFYEHPEWYTIHSGDEFEKASKESVAAVMAMRDNPDAVVTIYRAVPTSVSEINRGDFITLSPTYAAMHNESSLNSEGHVISMEVTAKDLWFNGDSINEFGYDPVPDSKFVDSDLNKYSPDQERDERGRFGSGSGSSSSEAYTIPQNGFASQNNLVSNTLPHVGLSDKAKDVASRITNVESETNGNESTHTATYTDRSGKEFELNLSQTIREDGISVDGKVEATLDGERAGMLSYGSLGGTALDLTDFNEPVAIIDRAGASAQGSGLATAMLELARLVSPVPVLHSTHVTDEGNAFAESSKAFKSAQELLDYINKYSPDQERDERGRFGSGSGSSETSSTDSKTKFVSDKIKEKTTALESQGAKITSLQNQDELIEAFDSLERLAEQRLNDPALGMNVYEAMEMDSGFTMTREALDHVEADFLGNPDEVRTIAVFDASGEIAGATSLTMGVVDGDTNSILNLNYLGTTGMVDGAGSALFGEAISFANEMNTGIQLHALDSEAYNFWVSMGFAHESGSTVFKPNEYLTMDSDTVANIAQGMK